MQQILQRIPPVILLKLSDKRLISPSISIHVDRDRYVVKTADNFDEISQVVSLRHEIFYTEFSTKKLTSSLLPLDIDFYDFGCDHLIVKEKSSDRVIACYRLRSDTSDKKIKRFYSEGEFEIDAFLNSIGGKLELGRACVHKDFRKGTVISLLWAGVLDYAQRSGARFMFGCCSVGRHDFIQLPEMMSWLEENEAFLNDLDIQVRSKYRLPKKLKDLSSPKINSKSSRKSINSLMYMYILAGAKLSRNIAYDADLDCVDFFTLVDLDAIPKSFKRKFAA